MIGILKKLFARYREFAVYCCIGVSGVALDFLVFALLTRCLDAHYQLANAASVSFGICNNFFWNAFLNFRRTDRLFLRFLSFYGVGLTGLGISAFLLWLLVDRLGCGGLPSKAATIVVVTVVQFFLNKFVTFRKGSGK